jgi:hypothetical protein
MDSGVLMPRDPVLICCAADDAAYLIDLALRPSVAMLLLEQLMRCTAVATCAVPQLGVMALCSGYDGIHGDLSWQATRG